VDEILKRIGDLGIVPVIKIEDPDQAAALGKAMCAGGLPLAEITFRTANAAESIRNIAKHVPEMLVGAGTVISCEQVDRAIDAGAKFIVSPGFNEKVVRYCIGKNITVTPGCSNPSDIERAIECGLDVVKFFPAGPLGGLNYIKAVAPVYPQMKFIPTGGINAKNLNEYLACEKILACGGSWLTPSALLAAADYDSVTAIVREAVSLMLGFSLRHIGINAGDGDSAKSIADAFANLLGERQRDGGNSIFAGTAVEVMKRPYLGTHGHIVFGVNSIPRALAYLKTRGVEPEPDTVRYDDAGGVQAIYLKGETGGFAVHLVRN